MLGHIPRPGPKHNNRSVFDSRHVWKLVVNRETHVLMAFKPALPRGAVTIVKVHLATGGKKQILYQRRESYNTR